ncbi:MAG TPA: helix-turn-helix domain-containing protein [Anaerolineales bacterium]|nr:helix-turn-helix domain-containing protein [Anaerolineales bacterium]
MPGNWLTLSEVSEILGIHPSTVRNWADQGILPVHRTQGGHRRFMKSEMDLWMQAQRVNKPESSEGLIQNALSFARIQISEAHLEKQRWYQKIDKAGRASYRMSGRLLVQGLIKSQVLDDNAAAAEARVIGVDYASNGRRFGLTVLEAVQAFLFFRDVLQEAAYHAYESAAIQSPYAWGDMFRDMNAYTDRILLTIIETYQAYERGENGKTETSKANMKERSR